jgi:hypothetical protein
MNIAGIYLPGVPGACFHGNSQRNLGISQLLPDAVVRGWLVTVQEGESPAQWAGWGEISSLLVINLLVVLLHGTSKPSPAGMSVCAYTALSPAYSGAPMAPWTSKSC